VVLAALAALITAGIVGWFGVQRLTDSSAMAPVAAVSLPDPSDAVPRPTLTISRLFNLSQPTFYTQHFALRLLLTVSVEFDDPGGQFARASADRRAELQAKFVQEHSVVWNRLNDVLTMTIDQKRPGELSTPEGKEQLRQELVTRFNRALDGTDDHVAYVNFTEFVLR
jgi:hypothetical protein